MTNAEKYKEVFGMDPETNSCPTHVCLECPCCKNIEGKNICSLDTRAWWQDDYKDDYRAKWGVLA